MGRVRGHTVLRWRTAAQAVVWAAWLVVGIACSSAPPDDTTPIIPQSTRVADDATLTALTAYDPGTGTLRFSSETDALRDLRLDDVFVAEPSPAAPHGLLRRVHSVVREGDDVVVQTSQANLTDAIHQGELDATGTFTAADMLEPTLHVAGVSVRAMDGALPTRLERRFADDAWGIDEELDRSQIGEGYTFHVGLDDVLLDVQVEGVRVRLHVTGEVSFNAGYRVGLAVGGCWELPPVCLKRFEASIGVEQLARVRVTGDASVALEVEKLVASIPFAPIVVFIGPVPVVFVPAVDVYVGGSGAVRLSFTYGVTERFAALIGARWTPNTGWRDITEFGLIVDGYDVIDVNASFTATVYVKPEGKLLLYGAVGPTLTLAAGIEIDAVIPRNPVWRVVPFLRGSIAFVIEVPVLGKLGSYGTQLFDHTIPGRSAPNAPPQITLRQTRLRVPLRAEIDLRANATVRDREDPFVTVTLRSSRADDALGSGSAARFTTVGLRTITVEAVDSQGARASAAFEVDVYNPPPVVFAVVTETQIRQSVAPPAGFLVPLTLALGASDPVDGRLPCSAIFVSVAPPDTISQIVDAGGGACEAVAHFYEQGPRGVAAYATDADGIRSATRTYTLTVIDPPSGPPPVITQGVLLDGAKQPMGTHYACWSGLTPFRLSVEANEPRGTPLTYAWTLRHYALGGASPIVSLTPNAGSGTVVDFPTAANPVPSWAPAGDGAGGPWTVAVRVSNGETVTGANMVFSWQPGRPCVN